jgi:hypothetical protein
MENIENIAQVFFGYAPSQSCAGFEHPGLYFVGAILNGEKIFNSQATATTSGLQNRINDVVGHLKKRRCMHGVVLNGYRIEDGGHRLNKGRIVECDPIPVKKDPFFELRFYKSITDMAKKELGPKISKDLGPLVRE